MKLFILIGFVFISGFVNAQIRVNNAVKNLGDIYEGSGKVTVKFELQNPYRKDTIHILDIITSCGCTAALTEDTLILPLSTINLDVSYNPKGRLGMFVKSIEITTKTGNIERNKLFLKIAGNVVSENYTLKNVDKTLVEYHVAPIYFFPVTPYDTSYLDFNFITDFINDLTYEIDFYQFTTIGFEIKLPDFENLERLEYLLKYTKAKALQEFEKRGYSKNFVFFNEPIFIKSTDLPALAAASIRVYSVNFDAKNYAESSIKVNSTESINKSKLLLEYERFAMPEVDEIVKEINFESIEGKLFLNGELSLGGSIYMPWKKSNKAKQKMVKQLTKAIQKRIKKTTGATKKEVRISFDSLGVHPKDKYKFTLWDEADQEEIKTVRYQVKQEKITPPFLPTYKQFLTQSKSIDTASVAFKRMWNNILLNYRGGHKIKLLIESSVSTKKIDGKVEDKASIAAQNGKRIAAQLKSLFTNATNGDSLEILVKTNVRGPHFSVANNEIPFDFSQFDYISIIPIVHNNPILQIENPKPYMVNFDYFFRGIDTGAWGFQHFAKRIATVVEKQGFVELRIESSISKIPIEHTISNQFLAYSRLLESQIRLKLALEKKLIDPNRIIFVDEHVIEQGPIYDGTKTILSYRKYHYIRIIPESFLE